KREIHIPAGWPCPSAAIRAENQAPAEFPSRSERPWDTSGRNIIVIGTSSKDRVIEKSGQWVIGNAKSKAVKPRINANAREFEESLFCVIHAFNVFWSTCS